MTRTRPRMARNGRSRASSNAQRDGSPRGKRPPERARTKPATDGTMKDAEKPPYKPTPVEAKALEAFRAARETRGPHLKVAIEGDAAKINPDHPDDTIGTLALMQACGTADFDFFDGLTLQLVNASKGQGSTEKAVNFMLAVDQGHRAA